MNKIALIFLLICLQLACHQEKKIYAISYTPVTAGRCRLDSLNTYHFIKPKRHKGSLPLLIILDPGGNGLMAVKRTQPAVSQFPCLVVGSDRVRNYFQDYIRTIDILIREFSGKYSVSKVYIAGFSGGARMAFEYARLRPVEGVLMCGAGPSVNSSPELPCAVYMISGTTDFNFSETYYNPLKRSGPSKLVAGYFRGGHEWPPPGMLEEGFVFLMGKNISGGDTLLKHQSMRLSNKADSMVGATETFFALKAVELALQFDPENSKAKKQWMGFITDPGFQEDMSKIESYLKLEGRINKAYAEASLERDSIWWFNEIKKLSIEMANSTAAQKDHFMRIKAFLGILFYSRLNTLLDAQPANVQIIHLLAAYKKAEPKNPDVYYDYALYSLKQGSKKLCLEYLNLSISLGFNDQAKLNTNFPDSILKKVSNPSR